MTEPKRWDWKDDVVRLRDDLADAQLAVGASRRERDRLRDERDEMVRVSAANIATTQRNMNELRRVAGVLADALRETTAIAALHYQGSAIVKDARSALAVFDTLTEEKT